jgi:PAS domain S-box-containing protein
MSKATTSNPLARRLCNQYLLFSMVGLLTFFAIVVYICVQLPRMDLVAASMMIPCLVFFVGSVVFKRSVYWLSELEAQLTRFADPTVGVEELKPIPSTSNLANGWNQLLAKVQQQEVWNGVERRLSESFNAQQVRRWEAIFQQLSDGVVLCDESGVIVESNRAFSNLVGVTDSTHLVGQPLVDSIKPLIHDPESIDVVEQMVVGPANQVGEVRMSDRVEDGIWRISMRRSNQESLGHGAMVWTVRDITQPRLAERAREQFVITATHELRTPLANIRAYAETLSTAKDIDVEQQQDFFNVINNEATRLARFVDELLNVSQMEAGAITVQKHEIYLERLMSELIEQQRPLSVEKSQQLEYLAPPKMPRIRGDKDKLAGAISNLIGNAIKYTPDGGAVKIRVENDPHHVFVHVEDTGYGISKEDIVKLGSKFYRSSDERVQNLAGNGLGLAFVQEVARLHGGRLNIRSEINAGSCFTLEIPIE